MCRLTAEALAKAVSRSWMRVRRLAYRPFVLSLSKDVVRQEGVRSMVVLRQAQHERIHGWKCTLIQLWLISFFYKASYLFPLKEKVNTVLLRAFVRKNFSHQDTKAQRFSRSNRSPFQVPACAGMTGGGNAIAFLQHSAKSMIRAMMYSLFFIALWRQFTATTKGHTLPPPKTAQGRSDRAPPGKVTENKTPALCKPLMKFSPHPILPLQRLCNRIRQRA